MSKDVEVTGIKMTATVPEDLQISLGEIANGSSTVNLAGSGGYLTSTGDVVTAPADSDDDDPFDWSSSAEISAYYDFGKLIPASSTNGENVYFTPDAAGVGKTLKTTAASYTAVAKTTAASGTVDSPAATAHVKTSAGESTWASGGESGYTTASAWATTNDDGYYIDIPFWLRTSSTTAPSVYVTGYIKKGDSTSDDDNDVLYQAVRVAVLKSDGSADGGVIDLSDQSSASSPAYPTTQVTSSLIDSGIANANFANLTSGTVYALNSATESGSAIVESNYGEVTVNKGATSIGTLTANTAKTAQYAASTKFILRVWLEGEDVNCWNANAGQDWQINLKFMTSALGTSN